MQTLPVPADNPADPATPYFASQPASPEVLEHLLQYALALRGQPPAA